MRFCVACQPSVCPRGIDIVWRTLSPDSVPSLIITPLHAVLMLRYPLVSSHLWLWCSLVFFFIAPHLWKYCHTPCLLHLCHGVHLGMRGTNPHMLSLAFTCTLDIGILSELLEQRYIPYPFLHLSPRPPPLEMWFRAWHVTLVTWCPFVE